MNKSNSTHAKTRHFLGKYHPANLVAFILLVILGALFVYWMVWNPNSSIPRQYTNEKLGFSLRYVPQAWSILEQEGTNTVILSRKDEYRANQPVRIQITKNAAVDRELEEISADILLQDLLEELADQVNVIEGPTAVASSNWEDAANAKVEEKESVELPNRGEWQPEMELILINNTEGYYVVSINRSGYENNIDDEASEIVESITFDK